MIDLIQRGSAEIMKIYETWRSQTAVRVIDGWMQCVAVKPNLCDACPETGQLKVLVRFGTWSDGSGLCVCELRVIFFKFENLQHFNKTSCIFYSTTIGNF